MCEKMKMVTCGLTGRRNLDIDYLEKALAEYEDDRDVISGIRNILKAISWNG